MALRKLFPTILGVCTPTGYSWQDKAHTENAGQQQLRALPTPSFCPPWAHKRAQPYLGDPTAQGVPSIQAPTWPLEQDYRCGRDSWEVSSTRAHRKPEKILEEPATSLREVGQPGRAGFLPPPCFQKSILYFSKAEERGPKSPILSTGPSYVQVTSLHVPQMFSQGPHSSKTAQTQYKQTKINRKFQHQADAEALRGLMGFFFCRRGRNKVIDTNSLRREFQQKTLRGLGRGGEGRFSTMLPRGQGTKAWPLRTHPTKMYL